MKNNIEGSDSIEVHTIDRYQGRDKDCIIISLVRKNEESKVSNFDKLIIPNFYTSPLSYSTDIIIKVIRRYNTIQSIV